MTDPAPRWLEIDRRIHGVRDGPHLSRGSVWTDAPLYCRQAGVLTPMRAEAIEWWVRHPTFHGVELAVDEAWRNRGIARELKGALFAARSELWSTAEIEVNNVASRQVTERIGGQVAGWRIEPERYFYLSPIKDPSPDEVQAMIAWKAAPEGPLKARSDRAAAQSHRPHRRTPRQPRRPDEVHRG